MASGAGYGVISGFSSSPKAKWMPSAADRKHTPGCGDSVETTWETVLDRGMPDRIFGRLGLKVEARTAVSFC